ncbi:APC family permease [Bergeyella zoohelcum]|uniref:Cationic amino acid transporter C-terminal domain-containing protein n=1 Tax=Bergeyella zoohelcum ATCC 43767 TaxID=883096 RepID=K1LQA4_9FLAO|nr:amino acid permease [Bergeyella zoohelcum]EKB56991.1 hypothetical protein HMPREF9699_01155 [Bergeyella zoohelcum ATCC 43767]SUV48663.1 Low-affinity putrescine importer PlaP [Bergeyella zoohelcum]
MNQLFKRKIYNPASHTASFNRVLGMWDIVFFGLAAIIGAGSFSSLGEAIFRGGPGVISLYIVCGIACGFTAMSYAEFASRIPTSGSAYTYAYASFGELIAWIIGWALIMEYSFGNIYVAFSWSDYFTSFIERMGVSIPDYFKTSYPEAQKAFLNHSENKSLINAWQSAPMVGGMKVILDIPALVINFLISCLVFVGISESKNFNNILVVLKLAVIVLIISVGVAYLSVDNWFPKNNEGVPSFMPNGFSGVMTAVSGVFFAYIGFDALSVLSEETKSPEKNLPRGMIIALALSTLIYILLTLVLTGLVDYRKFEGIGDPLAFVFAPENLDIPWMEFIISVTAIVAITTVLLVFQMGQPRIWYAMSRDGLLPKKFSEIHPRYKTPAFATVITGLAVGLPILFTDKSFILDFTSIGTIFAFVLVNAGVMMLPKKEKKRDRFQIPFVNSKILFPIIFIGGVMIFYYWQPQFFYSLLDWTDPNEREFRMSMTLFFIIHIGLIILSIVRNPNLIPLLGLSSCLYLLTGMTHENWFWFGVWFVLGLLIYFMYGKRNSLLREL